MAIYGSVNNNFISSKIYNVQINYVRALVIYGNVCESAVISDSFTKDSTEEEQVGLDLARLETRGYQY